MCCCFKLWFVLIEDFITNTCLEKIKSIKQNYFEFDEYTV